MKILVTGSTGFIGSELVRRLREQDHEVIEMVRYVAGGRYSYYDRKDVVFADLRDRETVEEAVARTQPRIIIHLAAQSAVSYSFINPSDVGATNYLGTVALAEAARRLDNLELFIFAGTSEMYGRATRHPTPEDEPWGATSPYAASKIAAGEFLKVLHQSYGFPSLIMLPFNTYGRALIGNSHYVVERAITQALTEHKIYLHDPRPYREFIFRDDHVNGYVRAIRTHEAGVPLAGRCINLASGRSYTIREMAEVVATAVLTQTGVKVPIEFTEVPDRPLDILKLEGDGTLAGTLLGWHPRYSLHQGLDQAVMEWRLTQAGG